MTQWITEIFSWLNVQSNILGAIASLLTIIGVVAGSILALPRIKIFLNKWKSAPTPPYETTQRLNKSIALMREAQATEQNFTAARLAQMIGMEKPGDLQMYLDGKQEPTFDFLERFADCFGLNKEWLKFGDSYMLQMLDLYFPEQAFLSKIMDCKPEVIYFVREDAAEGQTIIVLSPSEHKFIIVPDVVNISSHVGGGGTMQIVMFYHFIRRLISLVWETNAIDVQVFGRFLSSSDFDQLMNGMVYPGKFLRPNVRMNKSHWWEDFINIDHDSKCEENFKNDYGHEFIKAQEIVRYNLDKFPPVEFDLAMAA